MYRRAGFRSRWVSRTALLVGEDVKVPVNESVKPLTIKDREKFVPAIDEIFAKNREK